MPLHFFVPIHSPCKLCGEGFEHHARTGDAPITECPTCGQQIRRQVIQSANTPKLSGSISVSMAKQVGFAFLKRNSAGYFEKQ